MAVPAGFANLKNITVNYVTCFSATAPTGGSSILSKILAAMGGQANTNTGSGYTGTADAHVVWNMSNGTAAEYTAAIACVMLLISFAILLLLNFVQHIQRRKLI